MENDDVKQTDEKDTKIKDLPEKAVEPEEEKDVKGGRYKLPDTDRPKEP